MPQPSSPPRPGLRTTTLALAFAAALSLPRAAAAAEPPPAADASDTWGAEDEVATGPAPAPTTVAPVAPAAPPVDEEKLWRKRQHQRFRAMMISGFTTLGASYGASLLLGTIFIDIGRDDDDAQKVQYGTRMVIPLGGPFAAAAVSRSATGAVFTVAAGVGQVLGLTLGIVGAAKMRQYPDPDKKRFALGVMPSRGGAHAAMRLHF